MTDNELFHVLLPLMRDGLRRQGIGEIEIAKQYQPTQQGIPCGNALYLQKISEYRYGYPDRKSVWDRDAHEFIHIESIWMQTTFQANALIPQDPQDIDRPTVSDVLNLAAYVLQSDAAREALMQKSIGIYRIQNIRQIYFVNDKDRFEASPSFDFTLTHQHVITSRARAVETFEYQTHPV